MNISIKSNYSTITYVDEFGSYITVDEYPTDSLMVKEFRIINKNIPVVEILDIFVEPEHRHKGIGSILLKTILEKYKNYVILLLVGVSEKEFPNLDEKDIPTIITNLLPFYTKNGFVNVNNVYGSYNNFIPMIYVGNDIGKNITNNLNI